MADDEFQDATEEFSGSNQMISGTLYTTIATF